MMPGQIKMNYLMILFLENDFTQRRYMLQRTGINILKCYKRCVNYKLLHFR